ncbi:HD domain-containing protein [Caulobacter sp. S45]|uniref:HD domain-containing protein n=1 Tax=Caulobacter sp. S45 TaxID=1641861 RepID=UPI00131B5EDF|nr:HD domain-containing protein [Caulobacter sp. S45]
MADGEQHADARAKFAAMTEGDADDWKLIMSHRDPFLKDLPNRIVAHLKLLGGDYGGYAVDRLEHSLQTATRAHRAGEDEEYVVCALLHDIGDTVGPANHGGVAAAILKPYVGEDNHWMVENHTIFQGYYFYDFTGRDRNARDRFRGHPGFERTARFCHLYDQKSFDPAYGSMPLEAFEPMLGRVLSSVRRSAYDRVVGAAAS